MLLSAAADFSPNRAEEDVSAGAAKSAQSIRKDVKQADNTRASILTPQVPTI